jgi:uncharacterized protein (TIGR04255 family)
MSKLPNAPLVEVIFELRWKVTDKNELAKCQYLHGDLFALIKDDFKYREALIAPEVPMELYLNVPAHRFRVAQNDYPLVQVGPGLLTLNTIDSKYVWEDFEKQIIKAIHNFFKIYEFDSKQEVSLTLQYFDFFHFNFDTHDIYKFLAKNLNITVEQSFFNNSSNPNNLNLGFHYNTDLGSLSIGIARGKNNMGNDGIIMQTSILSKSIIPDVESIQDWLGKAQDFCSNLFKKMTKGELYNSFLKG